MKFIALPLFTVLLTSLTIAQKGNYAYINKENKKLYEILNYRHENKPIVRTVTLANGIKLEYSEQGSTSGIPVVMLHGFPDSRRSYDLVFPLLPTSIHAYAISFRGFGDSEKPEDGYSPGDFADDVAAFLNAMKIKKAVIVGHSMGATVAQQFAISHPGKIAGLVLIGGLYRFDNRPDLAEFNKVIQEMKDPVDTALVREFQQSTLYKEIPADFFATIINESMKVPSRVWANVFGKLIVSRTRDGINKFDKPTLILWGEKDAIASRQDQESIKAAIKNSELVVYNETGHDLQWEAPERFTNDLVNFVLKVRF